MHTYFTFSAILFKLGVIFKIISFVRGVLGAVAGRCLNAVIGYPKQIQRLTPIVASNVLPRVKN